MTPAIRTILHLAIDAGQVADVTIRVADRAAQDRLLALLVEQGWELTEPKLIECPEARCQWWQGYAKSWTGSTHEQVCVVTVEELMSGMEPLPPVEYVL